MSEIGFGAWAIGGNAHGNSYGTTDDAESLRAVGRAVELGCTFFDTADVYGHGHSEELLGRALGPRRRDVVICTKVGGDFYHGGGANFSPQYVRFAAEQCLRRLGTDYLDVLLLHNPPITLIARADTYAELEQLRSQGKIRHFGVSVHPPEEGIAAASTGKPAAVEIVYSVIRQEAAESFFPVAQATGTAVIAREPLGNGLLTGKYDAASTFEPGDIRHRMPPRYIEAVAQTAKRLERLASERGTTPARFALRFVLDNPAVSVVIPGTKTLRQVEENLGA